MVINQSEPCQAIFPENLPDKHKHFYRLPSSCVQNVMISAMLLGLVLFKVRHISWKKEQKQGFFQPKKNIFFTIFSKFVVFLDNILLEE